MIDLITIYVAWIGSWNIVWLAAGRMGFRFKTRIGDSLRVKIEVLPPEKEGNAHLIPISTVKQTLITQV
jgi:hypothetical protein